MSVTNRQQVNGKDGREERLALRVSLEEKRKFGKLAKSRYTDISELIRQVLHRETDTDSIADWLRQRANGDGAIDRRDEWMVVKVSRAEKRKFGKLAKSRHTDVSELIRQVLHREADTKTLRAGA